MLLSALTSFLAAFLSGAVADIWSRWSANQDAKALGRAEAVSDAQTAALDAVVTSQQVELAADRAHAADPSDAAFDQDFKRP